MPCDGGEGGGAGEYGDRAQCQDRAEPVTAALSTARIGQHVEDVGKVQQAVGVVGDGARIVVEVAGHSGNQRGWHPEAVRCDEASDTFIITNRFLQLITYPHPDNPPSPGSGISPPENARALFGGPRPSASALRCRGCCRPRRRRGGAVRSCPTGCASWNPVCLGPRGSDLSVRPLFSAQVGGIEDDAGDIDEAGIVEPMQHGFVQATPDAGTRPDEEPAVSGRLRYAEAGRQSPPGAATDQHIDDGREQRLIRRVLRSTALRPHPRRRDQRLRDLPQAVGNNPTPRTPPHTEVNDASPHRTRSNTATVLVVTGGQVRGCVRVVCSGWCGPGVVVVGARSTSAGCARRVWVGGR